ncbi:MAG: type IV secretion system protein [Deltaproteobacteria bacterium]|nr:type IV secretion system protein [Deltaproteobacteria bacterium]
MKKLILLLFLSILLLPPAGAFAMGSPQSANHNGPNYVAPAAPAASNPQVKAALAQVQNRQTIQSKPLSVVGHLQKAIVTEGPQLAGRLHNISGEIFGILTLLAFIWLMMPMWFKGMDWGAIVMFWVKVLIIYGMLREYNYFWNEGIVGFFIYLVRIISNGQNNILSITSNYFTEMLNLVNNQLGTGLIARLFSGLNGKIFLVGIEEVIILISFMMVLGTVFLVEIYIVIALVTGYIFIPFAVIKQGEFLFNGWLKFLISSAFSYFLISMVIILFSSTLAMIPATYQSYGNSIANDMLLVGFLLLFAYVVIKIPSLAGEIIAGTPNISVGAAVGMAVGAASMITGGARSAREVGSGADKYLTAKSKTYNKVKDFTKNRFKKGDE